MLWYYIMAQTSTLEYAVEAYFVNRVKALGGFSLKSDQIPGRRFLDRIAFLPGGIVLVAELKRPKGGRYSAHQNETIEMLAGLGHKVWRLKTKQEVDECLTTILKSS